MLVPVSVTQKAQQTTCQSHSADFDFISAYSSLWRLRLRFDMPEYSLDSNICGRAWLLASIEDSLLQSSFNGDIAMKGALVIGSSGTGKTKIMTHLVLHSAIAQDVFVESVDFSKGTNQISS